MRAALGDALDATRAAEQRAAARALLRSPLLRGAGRSAEAFVLVRRHETALREWFERNTGWRLEVGQDVARLHTTPPDPHDATHPLREERGERRPFSRRRYVLVALCLAALERADAQVTLGRLAEAVVLLAADPDLVATGTTFTLEARDQRLDLVAVVRVLLGLGVLHRVAGAEDAFVREDGDALYDVDRRVLGLLLVTRQGPSTVAATDPGEQLAALAQTSLAPAAGALSEEARLRALRHRLTQLLLTLPVVHTADLSAEEVAYLTSQRTNITQRISELTGLVPEVRAEGIAMVDPDDALTDVKMPESGTDGHLTLLVAEHLAAADRRAPGHAVPLADLRERVRQLAVEHAGHWREDTRAPGAQDGLLEAALDRLAALRLVARCPDAVRARPAIHRYAVTAAVVVGAAGSTTSRPTTRPTTARPTRRRR